MNLRRYFKTAESARKNGRPVLYVIMLILIAFYIVFSILAGRPKERPVPPDIDTDALASRYIEAFSDYTTAPTYSEEDIAAHFSAD